MCEGGATATPRGMDEHSLGALLLQNPLMREEDLERCLAIQQITGGTRKLGQIVLDEGILTKEALDELLSPHQGRREGEPAPPLVDGKDPERLLRAALAASASDLILSEGRRAMARIGGRLQHFTSAATERPQVLAFLERWAGVDAHELVRRHNSTTRDFAVAGVCRGRINAFCHFEGLGVVVRLHPDQPRDAAEAGLDAEIIGMLEERKGMVLVAGEVRSGVTETLGAILEQLRREKDRLIMVLDENLEYSAAGGEALVIRRRVGQHAADYCTGLRSAIDQDPDAVLVGDASEPQVFDLCLRAAEAGRLVVAAVRTRFVVGAIQRVLGCYAPRDAVRVRTTLAGCLRCAMAIQLVPVIDRVGQVLATEVLRVDDAVREVIREGELSQLNLLMRLEASPCGRSMDDSLLALLQSGRIRFEDAFARAEDKTRILTALRREQ